MKLTVAQTAGFCFGVDRAVSMVEQEVARGGPVVTLGPIIHNRHVVARFEKMGVQVIDAPEQAMPGQTVIIRSHGVARDTYAALEARGAKIVDATCPFVARIHEIVAQAEREGRMPVIIGTPTHPEVVAIAGWCENPQIFETAEEFRNWVEKSAENADFPITIVSQTTGTQANWTKIKNIAKKQCTDCKIFDTICKATELRQNEATQLSRSNDAMIIVGDAKSSNTGRLAAICREHCRLVALVDSAEDLDRSRFSGAASVGVTAGASTPSWIIKEVKNKMSEEILNETAQEESFEALLEQSLKPLNNGDKVIGTITSITPTEINVDLVGSKYTGYIPYSEVSADPTVKPETVFTKGQEVELSVVRVSDQEGTVTLSKKRLDSVKVWDEIELAKDEKTVVEGVVTEENKGGIVASVKGIRVFIPASQTGVPKGGELGELVKTTVQLKITEVNRSRRRVVGSIRAVASEARKAAAEQIWNEIEVGKKYHGTVKSLTSYGAFVDIGGVDGMVHVSELSWNRIKTPADVVAVGDEIDVYVISFDPEKKKISLGYKTDDTNPWVIFQQNYHTGDVVNCKVVKLMTFGAFAEIIPGVDGLIHISQIADRRIGKPGDVLSEGQEVEAKIIDIDAEKKRISLSIRALLEPQGEPEDELFDEAEEAEEVEEAVETVEETVEAEEAPAEETAE